MKNSEGSILLKIIDYLAEKKDNCYIEYIIPSIWNKWGYKGKELKEVKKGEIIVNPYNYYYDLINSYILPKKAKTDYNLPYYCTNDYKYDSQEDLGGDWIRKSIVYSMMIRTSTSWDHDNNGELDIVNKDGIKEIGTFLKTLTLLPHLKRMGVDVVYLLPITKYSLKNKKGELGSPYSVSNFFELDSNLKDPLLGSKFSVEDEFKAFVEACHILNMKVIIDIIPRTIAIENDLILDHPEWFYWINCNDISEYSPPIVHNVGKSVTPLPDVLSDIYKSDSVWEHINKFSHNPKIINETKYKELVAMCKQNKNISISDLIKQEFNIQIAPAFSDHINDPQPAWTDITFFRMYEDHPILTKQELKKYRDDYDKIPPYILFDTIKSNIYKGEKPNKKLWEMLSGIIPHYQKNYGIDGARIDMGHALPKELLDMIIIKARENDPHFCFIAEELNSNNAKTARNLGYNMIIGDSFWREIRFKEKELHSFVYNTYKLECPVFACAESHDTPRLASRDGERKLAMLISILNMFIPNSVPFINSGQEVYERQPMNTGLDVQENALYMLDENDPFFMKLALFDKYALHYLNEGYDEIPTQLEEVVKIRNKYINIITDKNNFYPLSFNNDGDYLVVAYKVNNNSQLLLILANVNFVNDCFVTIKKDSLPKFIKSKQINVTQLYSLYNNDLIIDDNDNSININLKIGEVKIILI